MNTAPEVVEKIRYHHTATLFMGCEACKLADASKKDCKPGIDNGGLHCPGRLGSLAMYGELEQYVADHPEIKDECTGKGDLDDQLAEGHKIVEAIDRYREETGYTSYHLTEFGLRR